MTKATYDPPAGFLTLQQACERLGWNQPKLRRRIAAGTIDTFSDPNDARVRLLKVADVEKLTQALPVGRYGAAKLGESKYG